MTMTTDQAGDRW